MKPGIRLRNAWEYLRRTLWFVPSVMAVVALATAMALVSVDEGYQPPLTRFRWLYAGGAEGARELLSAIAASMITVAGVAFSATIVALSLASQQFGPRLLRNFLRDPANQWVLGIFIATFLYCMLVLRTVRGVEERDFVPHVAVTGALLLALVSLAAFIYFVHRVSSSIQASSIIARVGAELEATIERLFPKREARAGQPEMLDGFDAAGCKIAARSSGYVQSIDTQALVELARANDARIRLHCRPGDFVFHGMALATLSAKPTGRDGLDGKLCDAIGLGADRTPVQDVEFGVDQLVEIALRALGSAANDPYTVVACIDRLCSAFALFGQRTAPGAVHRDEAGTPRLELRQASCAELVGNAFDKLRQYGAASATVLLRLLHAVAFLANCMGDPAVRAELRRQAEMIDRSGEKLPEPLDREAVHTAYANARRALDAR